MKRTLAALSLASMVAGCAPLYKGAADSTPKPCARNEPETGFAGPRVIEYSGCPFTVILSRTDTLGVRHVDTVRDVLRYTRARHGGVYLQTPADTGKGSVPPGPHGLVYDWKTKIIPPELK